MDFVKSLETIAGFMDDQGYRYALIGGLALAAYGHPRATLDLDLVVERDDQDRIVHFMESLGFNTMHRSKGYSNHSHSNPEMGRVDFVYIHGRTSEQLFDAAADVEGPGGRMVPVPKAEHLVAMKVLAMKNDPARSFQEMADIRSLMIRPGVEPEVVREYFQKHDLEERYDELETTL